MLTLAYFDDELLERGEATDYAEVARRLGLTRPRMSQVMGLRLLSARLQ